MRKLIIVSVSIAFMFLLSCSSDNCNCTKRTYNYDGNYPTSTLEDVDCPDGLEDGENIIEWRDDDRIDNVVNKTCI